MKKNPLIYLLLIVLFVLASCTGSEPNTKTPESITANDWAVLNEILHVEWSKAYQEQDTALLDVILRNDFQYVAANGEVTDKAFEMNWIKNNRIVVDTSYHEVKRFDLYDNGTAIIAGTGHSFKDSVHSVYAFTDVFIKEKGRWKAIASHVSGVESLN